jgi:hypothetical protein
MEERCKITEPVGGIFYADPKDYPYLDLATWQHLLARKLCRELFVGMRVVIWLSTHTSTGTNNNRPIHSPHRFKRNQSKQVLDKSLCTTPKATWMRK